MGRILEVIDGTNEWVGRQMKWLTFALIIVICSEVISRYVFNRPTIQLPVISTMTGCALYALSCGYIALHHAHVRIDILYGRLSPRRKAILDVVLTLLFFYPVIGLLTYAAGEWMWFAWRTGERSMQTYWYPPLGPIRTVLFIGLVLYLLQGIAQFVRDLHFIVRGKPCD